MKPFYFGRSPRRLFGVYEAPSEQAFRDEAVVLCHSAPQEYMQAHWTFRRLARQLSDSGFHVLRFDYFGTGDSAGESHEGTLAQWCQDIRAAADEILDVSGARHLSAVGFRLGATMTTMVDLRLRSLVLWEPVVHGRAYVDDLRLLHDQQFVHCLYPPRLPARGPVLEMVGHPFPPALQQGIEALELEPPFACRAERVRVVASMNAPTGQSLVERLAAEVPHFSSDLAPPEEAGGSPFLRSTRAPQRIVEFLASTTP
jgi:pimeloyl-ACP methyl ester carboxylesterase